MSRRHKPDLAKPSMRVMGWLDASVWLLCVVAFAGDWAAAQSFTTPINITQGEGLNARSQLSRNPQNTLLSVGPGRLVLAYFEGTDQSTLAEPSEVYLREWTRSSGWAARQRVDQPARQIGGRHPALMRRADGAVAIAWHDHRHTTQTANFINNLEIYGNTWTSGTLGPELRLTQSSSGTVGDNGYMPRLARLPDGRLLLVWYDFTWDPSKSEIAMRLSDANGVFGPAPAMNDTRITTQGTRQPGDVNQNFTMPSVAVTGTGRVHLTWITGTTAAGTTLYRAELNPDTRAITNVNVAATGVSGFFDPPRLLAGEAGDVAYLLYHDAANGPARLQRLEGGSSAYTRQLTPNGTGVAFPDAALDAQGRLHVVYVNQATQQVELIVHDPVANTTSAPIALSPAGDWHRPTITLDATGTRYVVWEQQDISNFQFGDLWFTTDQSSTGATDWQNYE